LNVLQGMVASGGQQQARDPVVDAVRHVVAARSPVLLRRDLQGCAWLVRVLPELAVGPLEPLPSAAVPGEQESELVARAILRFLANTARPGGTLLTLDSLHLADAPALELLAKLVRSAGEIPLRIIGAFRDSQSARQASLSSVLGHLAHEQRVRHLSMGALSRRDTGALLSELAVGQRLTASTLNHLFRETGGVPFYVVAVAAEIERMDGAPSLRHVPWPIRQSVRARIDALASSGPVLEAIAVAGGQASFPLLAALCGVPESDVLVALEYLIDVHLVVEDGQAYRFAYGVIGSVVDADLSHARRTLMRRRLAATVPSGTRLPGAPIRMRASGKQQSRDERAHHMAVLRRYSGSR
jgi:hypothetical protein